PFGVRPPGHNSSARGDCKLTQYTIGDSPRCFAAVTSTTLQTKSHNSQTSHRRPRYLATDSRTELDHVFEITLVNVRNITNFTPQAQARIFQAKASPLRRFLGPIVESHNPLRRPVARSPAVHVSIIWQSILEMLHWRVLLVKANGNPGKR